MFRILAAGIVGGLLVFGWGALAHTVLPLGETGIGQLPDESFVMAPMTATIQDPGLYLFPASDPSRDPSPEEEMAWQDRYRAGPRGMVVFQPTGAEPMSPKQLGTEAISNVLAALIGAFLLSLMSGGYLVRVVAVTSLGLFAWLSINVSYWNWFGFPVDFTIAAGILEVVGWLVAGLAMAAIVKAGQG